MTLNNHNLVHRMLKARQAGNNGTNGGNGTGGGGSAAASSATTSESRAAATSSDPPASTTTTQKSTSAAQQTTTSTTQTSKTVATTSTSQTPTTTSTSSTTSKSSTVSTTSTGVTLKSFTATGVTTGSGLVQASSFANVSPSNPNSPGTTITASAIPTDKTGGLGTGAIVGSVAGGLLGIAVLGMIIAFFLRRMRKRALEDEDFVTDFRQSAFVTDTPPSMAQRGHTNAAPSISSGGPGMAGQGAFRGGVTAAAASTPVILQERPRYVYGQEPVHNSEPALDDDGSEVAHGAYSAQPEIQQPYNPEAYGSYAAYESQAGYQEATREYQGQQGYEANSYAYEPQQHQGYAGYDYAAASAYADGHAPASGSHNAHHDAYGGM